MKINWKKGGVSEACNQGMKRAKGEFIGFLDSDDFLDPGWYENLYAQSQDFDFIRDVRSAGYAIKVD